MPFGRLKNNNRNRERIENTGKYANAPLAISYQVGSGVEYTNSKNFKLRMSPFFENFLVSTYKNPEALEVPFAYGFTVGAYWNVF
ncbi:MAG: hypothetical protein JJU02_14520 [Cryomorphaceae bacterium]|nr:hypothetical protein [Cryomorphaceae bacterium]